MQILFTLIYYIVFTEPSIYPNNIRAIRINDTAYSIVWDLLTLVEARGFVINYTVTLRPQPSRARQIQDVIIITVPHNVFEVIVTDLDFDLYEYSVTVRTNGGELSSPFQRLVKIDATSCICFAVSVSESITTFRQLNLTSSSSTSTVTDSTGDTGINTTPSALSIQGICILIEDSTHSSVYSRWKQYFTYNRDSNNNTCDCSRSYFWDCSLD